MTDPIRVSQNAFYPFIRYTKDWQPFRSKDIRPARKSRPIRYASRRDAYIFTFYRHRLSEKYEKLLSELAIEECPIAYRKIPVEGKSSHGKCNIHFAKDVFERISDFGNCTVLTMDISSYFERIDHKKLKAIWCKLLGQHELPRDHYSIFKAITKYSYVDRNELYERLGYIKRTNDNTKSVYTTPFRDIPRQICSPKDFREKICGHGGKYESLVHKNRDVFGIPQGSPISDLLANAYLLNFDMEINNFTLGRGGIYRRYCDDIFIAIPGTKDTSQEISLFVKSCINQQGEKLEIKDAKTSAVRFTSNGENRFTCISGKGKNGLEYLGFRFDGRKVYLKDSTLSRFHRKIIYSARHEVRALVNRFPGKDISYVYSRFDFSAFLQRFGRVDDFDEQLAYRRWTFWTYCRRAATVFGTKGLPILKQVKNYRANIRKRVQKELMKRMAKSTL